MRSPLLVLAAGTFCIAASAMKHETMKPGTPVPAHSGNLVGSAIEAPLPNFARLKTLSTPAAATVADAREARIATALGALAGSVHEQSDPNALKLAFEAYFNYKAAHPDKVRKPYLYFVDYGLDSRTPRGYVFDMDALRVVDGPFTVAHGRGSSSGREGVPTRFSNRDGSAATSLGLFVAQETYAFSGHSNGQLYHSIGMRLQGLSGSFNSAARSRGVVVHGAPYVTPSKAGRSEGCPAMEPDRARELIPQLSNGSLVFLFSPLDQTWLAKDPWSHADDSQANG
jgi:hypothetical protein